jgi:zinc finger protein
MIPCPACGRELRINTLLYDTPFFGKVLLTTITCECGFKHSDAIVSEIKEPTRFTVKINKETLYDKVIRSTSGTIRVPEIGVEIEPGPASQAFITNLEGVLMKIRDIVEMARRWNADDKDKVSRCDEILKKIDDTLEGRDELTLILEDPFGNSLILSDSAFRERMKEEEAKALRTGMTVMDLTGLSEDELFRL